ncbi:MAG: hypothetical protein AB1411_07285 [Nitrospirota bacterium]
MLVREFLSSEFLPHGQCLLWQSGLLWLHAASDTVITIAYYSIPATLLYFLSKRRDLAFPWVFLLFGSFIFLCGTTHLVGVWTLWQPVYWLDGFVKLMTAGVSIATAILLVPLIPKALALPSPAQLETMNQELRREIMDRKQAEEGQAHRAKELAHANAELERFNRLAVGRERRMIELKRQINQLLQETGRPPAYDLSFASEERIA